jgi:hypothetical protein
MLARTIRYCDLIDFSEIIPTLEHPTRPWHKKAYTFIYAGKWLYYKYLSNNVSRFLALPSMIEKGEMSEATQQQVHRPLNEKLVNRSFVQRLASP